MDTVALKNRAQQALKSFAPSQLAIIGLLTVAVAIGLMAFLRWSSAPSYGVLFSDLEGKDASAVVDKLESEGVPYELADGGATVMVPTEKVYDLRLSMSAAGIPQSGVVGYELLDKQGLTTSEFNQQVGYQRALEGELTRTLLAMEGMESATVHLAIPRDRLFTDDQEPARASVLVKTSRPLDDDGVDSIVHLVASSVPGLSAEGVTVADVEGHVLSVNGASVAGGSSRELRLTREFETELSGSVSALLGQVMGPGHAVVRVSADLNFDESERQTETYDPAGAVAVREEQTAETYKGAAGGNPAAGTLGVAGGPVATAASTTATDYSKTETAKEFGVNHVVETSKVAPGKVERLSVAVVLDEASDPKPDVEKVKQLVGAAAGLDPARGDNIVVDTMSFDAETAAAAAEAGEKAATAGAEGDPLTLVRTGLGGLVIAVILVVLVLSMRRTRVEAIPDGDNRVAAALAAVQPRALAATGAPLVALPAGADGGHTELLSLPSGDAVSDDVLRLVDQQPDEVAVLLRRWLGDRRS